MDCPEDLLYTKDHEWARLDEKSMMVTVGITDYAQEKLGDVVFVELPAEGEEVSQSEPFGSIESVKAVSDLFAPISGKISEINSTLVDSPEAVNGDPYGEAWMIKIAVKDKNALSKLMKASDYKKFVKSQDEGA